MEKIRRLRQKKGFTMIELIVVIAIIGVLLALIVPNLFQSDKPNVGRSYAKDYYYKVQSFMSKKKLANNDAITAETIFYVDLRNGVVKVDTHNCGIATAAGARTACSSITNDKMKDLVKDLAAAMDNNLSAPSYDGSLYAVVDSHYRVRATYWIDDYQGTNLTSIAQQTFTDTCVVASGYYACSYPSKYSNPEGGTNRVFDL